MLTLVWPACYLQKVKFKNLSGIALEIPLGINSTIPEGFL